MTSASRASRTASSRFNRLSFSQQDNARRGLNDDRLRCRIVSSILVPPHESDRTAARIGDAYSPFRKRNPKPYREVALDGGVIASAHRIAATADTHVYWVIGHRDDTIVSIQLTGNHSHPDLAFATIQLNDSEERVLALLGPRADITAVREVGGFLWDYRPFPISIEFVHGRVYSIKVTAPDAGR